MSLGGRAHNGGRHLLATANSTTSREPLLFLYPRYSQRPSSTLVRAKWQQHVQKTITSGRDLAGRDGAKTKASPSEIEAAKKRAQDQLIDAKFARTIEAMKAWGGMALGSSDDSGPAQFRLAPDGLRRSLTLSIQALEEKKAKAIVNAKLKAKGTWSYDWRVALQMLQDNTPPPGESNEPRSPEHATNDTSSSTYVTYAPIAGSQNRTGDEMLYWDKRRFLASVKAATKSDVPRVLQRFLYSPEDDLSTFKTRHAHKYQVRNALMGMFEDPAAYPIHSEGAYNVALRYLAHHGFLSDARKLINIMTRNGIPPTTASFNILLFASAKRHDLFNFTALLMTMIDRDVKPNADTWRNFIMTIESQAVRLRVEKIMKETGLLEHDREKHFIAMSILDTYIRGHIESGDSLPKLMETLDRKYETKGWFDRFAASKICSRLGDAGRTDQIAEMLKITRERGCKQDSVMLAIASLQCARGKDLQLALRYLAEFDELHGCLDTTVFANLFMLGWSTQSYNLCRLIWSVASSRAFVSRSMEKLTHKSLVRKISVPPPIDQQQWDEYVGKVIIGYGHGHRGQDQYHEMPERAKAIESLGGNWLSDPVSEQIHTNICKRLIHEDLTASGRFEYVGNFLKDVKLAMKMDEQWKSNEWRATCDGDVDDLNWKVRNAMKPKFKRRGRRNLELYLARSGLTGTELLPFIPAQVDAMDKSSMDRVAA